MDHNYLREREGKRAHDHYRYGSTDSPVSPVCVPEPVIVGAGPSGIAAAACLKVKDVPSVVLERLNSIVPLLKLKTYATMKLGLPKLKTLARMKLGLPKQFGELPLMVVEQTVPEEYIGPVDQRPNLSQVSDFEDVQVINYAIPSDTVETMPGVVGVSLPLPVEEILELETAQNNGNPTLQTSNSVHIDMQGINDAHPEHSPRRSSLINQLYMIYLIFMGILMPTIAQVSDHASTTTVLMGASLAMLFINILAASWVYYKTGKLTNTWLSFALYTIFIITGILSPVLAFSKLFL